MKITIEGTAEELRCAIGSFGIPQEVIFDDGEKFVPFNCGDLASRGHRASKDNAVAEAQITGRSIIELLTKATPNSESDLSYTSDTNPLIDLIIMAERDKQIKEGLECPANGK